MEQSHSYMVLDIERARLNNGMLVNRDLNCSRMIAGNTSGRALYQCNISTVIER